MIAKQDSRISTKHKALGIILAGTVATAALISIVNLAKAQEASRKKLDHEIKMEQILRERDLNRQDATTHEKIERQRQELQQQIEDLKKRVDAKSARLAAEKARQLFISTANAKSVTVASKRATGGCEQYRPLVSQYGWNVDQAMVVMSRESGCRTTAVSPTNDHGLFQVNATYHLAKVGGNLNALYDPATNIRIAYGIYAARGNWSAWYAVKGIYW